MTAERHSLPTEAALRAALNAVIDPEVGMNIVDLGLIYGLRIGPDRVEADVTMTTPSCPMGSMIVDEVRRAIAAAVPAGTAVVVNLVWEPPWDPSRMSERARKHFGW